MRRKKPSLKQFQEVAKSCNGIITGIAARFNVFRSTVYDWMDEDASFKNTIDEYRGQLVDTCLKTADLLARGIPIIDEQTKTLMGWKEKPDGQMIRYLLGVYGKREGFGEERLSINANIDYEKLSDSQLDRIAKQMTRNIDLNDTTGHEQDTD